MSEEKCSRCFFFFPPGSRRSSDYPEEEDEQTGKLAGMTEEEREYMRWYYRTEDREFVYLSIY